jgi:hypothetical protein
MRLNNSLQPTGSHADAWLSVAEFRRSVFRFSPRFARKIPNQAEQHSTPLPPAGRSGDA